MSDDIRALVREVIAEELRSLGRGDGGAHVNTAPKPQIREEVVEISSNADLNRFALRVLELAKDGRSVEEIKAGRWRFLLQHQTGQSASIRAEHPVGATPVEKVEFERGLVSERQVEVLSRGACVRVTKRVRFTPLALDVIRRKGIRVEREAA